VNEVPVHVVGVAPPAFQGALRNMDRPALWMPVSARADIARVSPRWLADEPSMEAFVRLAPDVQRDRATAIARVEVTRTLPDSATRVGMTRIVDAYSMHALLPESHELKIIFTALAVVGLLLLLVTCTNVSSLMVAAAVARRQEIAVRLSLGATRARILRQLLTEATLLAIAGGAAGLIVCWWMLQLLAGPGGTVDGNRVLPDGYTLAYTMLVAIGTGVIFGLSPAMHATRTGVATALRDSGAGATRQSRLQRGFVVAQIVFSLPLLVMLGASLSMVVSDYEPLRPEVSQRVARITFRPLNRTGTPGQRREAVDSLVPRIAAHPEVVGVVPEASWHMVRRFLAPTPGTGGSVDTAFATLRVYGAAPGWFALQDIPILLGRDVTLADTAGPRWPVVIGSSLARAMWGDAYPVGRTFASPGNRDSVEMEVVGVYDATRASTSGLDSTNVFSAHGKAWRADALVVLLASLGLYGVIALAVRQRTREIGIRIALGAKPVRVARMFLASGLRLGVLALVIGLPLSMAALRLLLTQGGLIAPRIDIWIVAAGVACVLLLVAAGATWLPARRAALVDPARTLRVD
jgi:cell division protein FtsX